MEVIDFCTEVGLPVTLKALGIEEVKSEQIMEVAKLACAPEDTMGNMPFEVTPEDLYAAIMGADALGRYYTEAQICSGDVLPELNIGNEL